MTVSSTTRTAGPFVGTGLVSTYSFSFYVFLNTDLLVQVTDSSGTATTLVYGSDYIVTLNSNQSLSPGGTITLTNPLPSGQTLVMTSQVQPLQGVDILNPSNFYPNVVMKALDYLTVLNQQALVSIGQSIKLPLGDQATSTLPSSQQRAGLLLGFDGSGQPAAVSGPIAASPVVATGLSETQTGANGQTAFTLTTMAYASATANSLMVFVDGVKLPASDFTQTSPTVVTLNTPLVVPTGSRAPQVEFFAGNFMSLSSGKFAAAHTTSSATDVGSFQFRRNVEYAGGTPGNVNACIRADTYVDNAAAAAFEWCGVFVLHNQATGGENVAIYGQGNKIGSAGPTWAGVMEVIDTSGGNPTSGAVGLEVDVRGDNGDSHSNRIGIDIVATRTVGSVAPNMTAAYGLRFQNGGDSQVTFGTLIGVLPGTVAGFGIDLSGATTLAGAMKMNQGVPIIFDNTGTPAKFVSQGLGLDHMQGTTLINRLLATGGLQVGSVQVVGPRVTGWSLPTGTLSRATFDQSTVTLAQLAQRVAALITDIYGAGSGHGLIGA